MNLTGDKLFLISSFNIKMIMMDLIKNESLPSLFIIRELQPRLVSFFEYSSQL